MNMAFLPMLYFVAKPLDATLSILTNYLNCTDRFSKSRGFGFEWKTETHEIGTKSTFN
uniref:Uncharacterized protein n=1 Tax=Rhizophora mucronata TaxID=61149 RepID=A0A2P2PB71_RHIMU